MEQPKIRESWFQPGYPPLKYDDVGTAAVNGQSVEYPKISRGDQDPHISGQTYGLISYNLLDIPSRFQGKPIYGFMKIRGAYDSPEVAKAKADKLILEVDSKFQVRVAPIGVWVPITEFDGKQIVEELIDVKDDTKEHQLRDDAVKQKETYIKKQAKELRDAEDRLQNGPDDYDDQESLRFYTMKRVTEMKLTEAYEGMTLKLRELEKTLGEQRLILKKLEKTHETFSDEWIDTYNAERAKTSIPKFIPSENQFQEYESISLESLTKYEKKTEIDAVTISKESDISAKSKNADKSL